MYILDEEANKKINLITIILNKKEMKQLLGYAKKLLDAPQSSEHYHLSSDDYQKEITICLFDSGNLEQFNPRIQKLIKDDE